MKVGGKMGGLERGRGVFCTWEEAASTNEITHLNHIRLAKRRKPDSDGG